MCCCPLLSSSAFSVSANISAFLTITTFKMLLNTPEYAPSKIATELLFSHRNDAQLVLTGNQVPVNSTHSKPKSMATAPPPPSHRLRRRAWQHRRPHRRRWQLHLHRRRVWQHRHHRRRVWQLHRRHRRVWRPQRLRPDQRGSNARRTSNADDRRRCGSQGCRRTTSRDRQMMIMRCL